MFLLSEASCLEEIFLYFSIWNAKMPEFSWNRVLDLTKHEKGPVCEAMEKQLFHILAV